MLWDSLRHKLNISEFSFWGRTIPLSVTSPKQVREKFFFKKRKNNQPCKEDQHALASEVQSSDLLKETIPLLVCALTRGKSRAVNLSLHLNYL